MEKEEKTAAKPKILAFAGKGGVGKTSLAAVSVKLLAAAHPDRRILAIDADPAVGLSTALGIEVQTTIDDIRKEVVKTVEEGNTRSAMELLGDAQYRITDAIVEADGFAFIAIGRPEAAGCYCKIISYLKAVIEMLSENFDYVVIDGEAGIEQINRRVMEKVTHLLLVTDSSKKGIGVIQTIKSVADELVMYEQVGAVVNRMPEDPSVKAYLQMGEIPVLAYIGADSQLTQFDLTGQNVFYLPEDAEVVRGMSEALTRMELL